MCNLKIKIDRKKWLAKKKLFRLHKKQFEGIVEVRKRWS